MRTVVITDSCCGLGYELAKKYLDLGWNVVINTYRQADLYDTEEELNKLNLAGELFAYGGNVSNMEDMKLLASLTAEKFGAIDLWINHSHFDLTEGAVSETSMEEMRAMMDAKLMGVMCGSKAAMTVMSKQGYGAIYTLEGEKEGILSIAGSAVETYMDILKRDAEKSGVSAAMIGKDFAPEN